jgi:hypothetical protein
MTESKYEVYIAYWCQYFNTYALAVITREVNTGEQQFYVSEGCIQHLLRNEEVYEEGIRSYLGTLKWEIENSPTLQEGIQGFRKYWMNPILISEPRTILRVEDIIQYCQRTFLSHGA